MCVNYLCSIYFFNRIVNVFGVGSFDWVIVICFGVLGRFFLVRRFMVLGVVGFIWSFFVIL